MTNFLGVSFRQESKDPKLWSKGRFSQELEIQNQGTESIVQDGRKLLFINTSVYLYLFIGYAFNML